MFSRCLIRNFYKNMSTVNKTHADTVLVDKIGVITTIGINRPDTRNSIDSSTAQYLEEAIAHFEEDEDSTAAVLYGTGGNFCSGFDLHEIGNLEPTNTDKSVFSVQLQLPSKKFVKKPMIAALSGYVVAGGLELALLCDLRVIEETAVLGLCARRFGIPLSDGATVRLPALVGLPRALDMILTGRSLTAKEAFDWGLANRIVACGTGFGQALQLATSLTKFPQECLNSDRESTYNAAFCQVYDNLLNYERNKAKKVSLTSIIEGAKKFVGGIGRHGKSYNLTEKPPMEWEEEYSKLTKSKL